MTRKISDKDLAAMSPDRQKAILRDRECYKKNQEKNRITNKKYYEKNKKIILEQKREFRKKNNEYINKRVKQYKKNNPNVQKKDRFWSWKRIGIKHTTEELEVIYQLYNAATECELCTVTLVVGRCSHSKCLDHDHISGCFRNVICQDCNKKRRSFDDKRLELMLELHRFFDSKK